MKRSIIFGAFAVIIMIGIVSPSVSAVGGTPTSPALSWSAAAGDNIELTLGLGIDMQVPQAIFDAMDAVLADEGITEFTSEDVFDLAMSLIPNDIVVRWTINSISGYDLGGGMIVDVVTATLTMKKVGGSTWLTPGQFINQTLDETLPQVYTIGLALGTIPANMPMADFITMTKMQATHGMGTNDPMDIAKWMKVEVPAAAQSSGSGSPIESLLLAIPYGGPSDFLALPNEWDFKVIYDEMVTEMDSMLSSEGMSWSTLVGQAGVSPLVVDSRAIAIGWQLNSMSDQFPLYPMVEDMLAQYEAMGITINAAEIFFGVEWDSKGLMSALGCYIGGDATINMGAKQGFPVIVDQNIPIEVAQTVAAPGVTPPTKDQILSGLIGEERPGAASYEGSGIPGYPLGIVGIVGVLATVVLVMKKKRT
jgi:hypothetical protein